MELWLRKRVMSFGRVLMRVPPLFVIDELLRISLGVPDEPTAYNSTDDGFKMTENDGGVLESIVAAAGNSAFSAGQNWTGAYNLPSTYTIYSYQMYLMTMLRFLTCCLGFVAALGTFMLSTKHLTTVYLYLVSVAIVFESYWSNTGMINAVTTYLNSKQDGGSIIVEILNLQFSQLMSNGPGYVIIQNYILQSVLAYIFCYINLKGKNPTIRRIVSCSFTVPCHLGINPIPMFIVTKAPVFAALVPLGVCKFLLWHNSYKIWKTICEGYKMGRIFLTNYGLSALAETQWERLHVPSVLRTFWILRVAEQVVQIMCNEYGHETFNYYVMIKTLMVNGCETLTAVLGMTSIISGICHYIGSFFHWVLLIEEDEKSIGTVTAMLFYVLALQTGLTSLDKENRLLRLCRNLCLLFTAVLHFIHNIVNPLLMSLSASHNPALHRHIRALGVCLFLIVFPVWLLTFLWSQYTISTWLLAVTVFSIEVIVKVLVSLAIYSLFLYDAYRKSFWDELDDWVYIIKAFGNTVEFAFGIILFFNGFWILVFEAGGAIRAMMMCVHAYFNLWCEAKSGWRTFMKRRHAVNKINLLSQATEEQLSQLADVCAICFQDMLSARITKCNHFFHGVCLRKWMYVQDRCPMCHEIMYQNPKENNEAPPNQENNEVRPNQERNGAPPNQENNEAPHNRGNNEAPPNQENYEEEHEEVINQGNNQEGTYNLQNQNNLGAACSVSRKLPLIATREQTVEER